MNSFIRGNWGLKLLSLLLAVVMWVYVSNDQTTTTEQEFKAVPVKIRLSSMPKNGYKVVGMQVKPDEVILRGPKSILNRIDQVTVEVDLKNRSQSFGGSIPVRVTDAAGRLLDEGAVKRFPEIADLQVTIAPDLPSGRE